MLQGATACCCPCLTCLHNWPPSSCRRRCQVRSCNLDEWNTSTLAAWELQPAQGLLRTLRILDVSINPGLAAADMEAFFGQMQLWEL